MATEVKDGTAVASSTTRDCSLEEGKVDQPPHTITEEQVITKHMSGPWKTILGQGALVSILMCGLAISMLVLMYVFELKSFKAGKLSGEYIFFRNVPTSAILCIASLASLLSIVLVRSLLRLFSFLLAHDLLVNTELGDRGGLPGTRDFSIVLRILAGSPRAYIQAWRRSFSKAYRGQTIVRTATVAYTYSVLFRLVILEQSSCGSIC